MAEQVDFYVLDQSELASRLNFACRLVSKIRSRQQGVTILVEDMKAATTLDDLLWRIPPESFIPHDISSDGTSAEAVHITASDSVAAADHVCINLRQQVPANHTTLGRLVEIVCQEPSILTSTRDKYKFYRQLSYPLQSHPINHNAL